jgi:Ca2+/Na+ antiporter
MIFMYYYQLEQKEQKKIKKTIGVALIIFYISFDNIFIMGGV